MTFQFKAHEYYLNLVKVGESDLTVYRHLYGTPELGKLNTFFVLPACLTTQTDRPELILPTALSTALNHLLSGVL